jgi:hypothetical protein
MCPVCLATMGLIVAGSASAGGLTALAREGVPELIRHSLGLLVVDTSIVWIHSMRPWL